MGTPQNIRNRTENYLVLFSPWYRWDSICCCVPLIFISALALTTCPDLWLALGLAFFCNTAFLFLMTRGLFCQWKTYFPWDQTCLPLQWSCIAYLSDMTDSFCSLPELQSHIPDCVLVISSGMCQSLFCQADCNTSKNHLHFLSQTSCSYNLWVAINVH